VAQKTGSCYTVSQKVASVFLQLPITSPKCSDGFKFVHQQFVEKYVLKTPPHLKRVTSPFLQTSQVTAIDLRLGAYVVWLSLMVD